MIMEITRRGSGLAFVACRVTTERSNRPQSELPCGRAMYHYIKQGFLQSNPCVQTPQSYYEFEGDQKRRAAITFDIRVKASAARQRPLRSDFPTFRPGAAIYFSHN